MFTNNALNRHKRGKNPPNLLICSQPFEKPRSEAPTKCWQPEMLPIALKTPSCRSNHTKWKRSFRFPSTISWLCVQTWYYGCMLKGILPRFFLLGCFSKSKGYRVQAPAANKMDREAYKQTDRPIPNQKLIVACDKGYLRATHTQKRFNWL